MLDSPALKRNALTQARRLFAVELFVDIRTLNLSPPGEPGGEGASHWCRSKWNSTTPVVSSGPAS